MSSQKLVTRSELYKDSTSLNGTSRQDDSSSNEAIIPHEELEIVEMNVEDEDQTDKVADNREFEYFPLFATEELTKIQIDDNMNTENNNDETPAVERSKSYYFSDYTNLQIEQFRDSAIDHDRLMKMKQDGKYYRYKEVVINLNEQNAKIEKELQRNKILKKRRPGKKQRMARKMGKENVLKREEAAKALKKLIKKKFHKRGGKKNKKKEKLNPLANAGANAAEVTAN